MRPCFDLADLPVKKNLIFGAESSILCIGGAETVVSKNDEVEKIVEFAGTKARTEDTAVRNGEMSAPLPKIIMDTETKKLRDEYWAIRERYEIVFGKYDPFTQSGPRPLSVLIAEMSDKLDEYYSQHRKEKRLSELVTA